MSAHKRYGTDEQQRRLDDGPVMPRELHEHLDAVAEKIDKVEDGLSSRITRIERVVIALTVAVASPKLGGPSVSDVVSGLVVFTHHL